jgi:ribose transport system substrate-binding protein
MRRTRFILLLLSLLLSNPGWAQPTQRPVIAFAQDTLKNDFRQAQVAEVRDAVAKYPELAFVYADAQGQTSLLIRQIEQFITQKVDVLVIGTNDEQAVVPVISKAYKAGIHVIILDRGIKGHDYSTFINSDNRQIGAMGAEFIAKKLKGQGLVLLFEGLQTADVTQLRSQGFMEVMAKHSGIKVIKRTGNYLRKDALLEMEKLSGARLAMQQQKVDPSAVISVGCDYTSEAREAIRSGTQTGSVLFPLGGTMAVDMARKLLNKTAVPRHVVIPVKLITRDNVEQVSPIF